MMQTSIPQAFPVFCAKIDTLLTAKTGTQPNIMFRHSI
jgi:hypothetical protein